MEMMKYKRICNLDILKGLMSILIVITHSTFADLHRRWMLFPLIVDMAVPVFLIISGFVNSINYKPEKYWRQESIFRKVCRIIIPFFWISVVEVFYWVAFEKLSTRDILINIIFQRWGDGGYYPIIMLQLIIFFPLIYRMSTTFIGCVVLVGINIVSEYLLTFFGGGYAKRNWLDVRIHT